jgi:hypothetical protein
VPHRVIGDNRDAGERRGQPELRCALQGEASSGGWGYGVGSLGDVFLLISTEDAGMGGRVRSGQRLRVLATIRRLRTRGIWGF